VKLSYLILLCVCLFVFSGCTSEEKSKNASKNRLYKAESSILFPFYKRTNSLDHLKKYMAGYMDLNGRKVIEHHYTFAEPFTEGLGCVAVRVKGSETGYGALYGYIDSTGSFVIEPQFVDARPFSNGRALVCNSDHDWGVINRKGELITELKYNARTTDYYNGYCIAYESAGKRRTTGLIKYDIHYYNCYKIDLSGNAKLIEAYTSDETLGKLVHFHRQNGLGVFSENRKHGYKKISVEEYDRHRFNYVDEGSVFIQPKYKNAHEFQYGYAKVKFVNGDKGWIDTTGQVVLTFRDDIPW
jgi:hypothetical protein